MKRYIIIMVFFVINNYCYSQLPSNDEFNKERVKITRQSMIVLGSWGAANLIYSGAVAGGATGNNKYFYQMNLIWGGVNFSLGAIGYLFSKNEDGLSYSQSLKKQMTAEKIFLFNTGLDVAYVAGGFYLKEKANNAGINKDRNKGYGQSIILQGAALFIFDGMMYLINQNHGKKLYKLADKLQIGATLNSLECIVKL